MNIKTRIKELRLEAKYTQGMVANYLHITQKAYCNYELNKSLIPSDKLIRLAELFDVSMDYLCCLTDERAPYPGNRDISGLNKDYVEYAKYITKN